MLFLPFILYLTNLFVTFAYDENSIRVHDIDVTTRGNISSDDAMKLCQTCFWPYQKDFTSYHQVYSHQKVEDLKMLKGTKDPGSRSREVLDIKTGYRWHGTTWKSRSLRCFNGYHCAFKLHWDPIKGWIDYLNRIESSTFYENHEEGWEIIQRRAKRPFIVYRFETDVSRQVRFNPVTWYQKGGLKKVDLKDPSMSKVLMDLTYETNVTLDYGFSGDNRYSIPNGIFDIIDVKM